MFKGTYRVYKDGLLVAEQPNLITDRGRGLILRYLAGNIGTFAGAIAVGSHTTPPAVTDTRLGFEFARGAITLGAANVPARQVVFKATIPMETSGVIYEMGLYPFIRQTDTEYFGQVYLGFDTNLEELTGGGVNTVNYRIGTDSYEATAAASTATATTSTTITAGQARGNFGGHGPSDVFSLAYFLNDANTASIRVRLYVDNLNYFEYTISPGAITGYRVTDWEKGAFVATGTPSWENITYADFTITAGTGGATTVQLDGLRVTDTDVYPDYGLVSRAVFATPIIKRPGEQMDVEYALEVVI